MDYSEYAVYFKSIQSGVIKSIVDVLREIIHDGVFVFTPDGIRLTNIDLSKCSFTHLKLNADGFETYVYNAPTCAGVNTINLHKLLKSASSHDTIAMYVKKSSPDILGITIENADNKSKTTFNLRLMDLDNSEYKLPDSDYDSVYTLPSASFSKMCRDMALIAPSMVLESAPGTLKLSCAGDFATQETTLGETDSGMVVENLTDAASRATYSLKFLTLVCKASSLSNIVEIFVKADHPLILKCACGALGVFTFLLTPLVSDGDDDDEDIAED
jgi:proliferating cell nuclear antigen